MTSTCTAAIFNAAGEPLELRDVPLQPLPPGEVRLQIECCTICGSDLHSIYGRRSCHFGTVLGHEVVGRIAEISVPMDQPLLDLEQQPLQVGDRVIFSIIVACGKCRRCIAGFPQKCEKLYKYGHQPADQGVRGGFASHIDLKADSVLLKIDATAPAAAVATLGCAGATAMCCLRQAGLLDGRRVVVFGLGMLGAMVVRVASAVGAEVVGVDTSQERIAFAKTIGAKHSCQPSDLPDLLDSQFGGGVDIALEMSGSIHAVRQAVASLDIGGRCVLAGSVVPTDPLELMPEALIRGLHELVGVHNYQPADLLAARNFFLADSGDDSTGREFLTMLQTQIQSFPLAQIHQAIQTAEAGKHLRVAVCP